jgi:hypothetical protein
MKTTLLPIVFASLLALFGPSESSAQTPTPTTPAGSHERVDLKVLKVFSAKDGDAIFRAYLVEWKGQEVVAEDRLVKTDHRVGDMVSVLVMRSPYPQGKEAHGLLHFSVMPPSRR